MDDVQDSDLNQAHYESRKADRLVRQGYLDKAIECHAKASTLLTSALSLSGLSSVQQSLTCQRDHHIRQVCLLQSIIAQLDNLQRKKMSSTENQANIDSKMAVMQTEILKTLSETDNALQLHMNNCNGDQNLNDVVECLRKMRNQLEKLFNVAPESDKEDLHSNAVLSPSVDTGLNEIESDLPALAPLEMPSFDFSVKLD